MPTLEANFDGIVGPTHNYAGLSPGNIASAKNAGETSSPRKAALQGLAKAKQLADMGLVQHVLPPLARPDIDSLRRVGFSGSDAEVLERAGRDAPDALAAACSASAMWAANAATVSPGVDTADGRLHMTPANLAFNRHRALEAAQTRDVLRAVFADESVFAVHEPLTATPRLFDEGAANHTRLCARHGEAGVEVFCFGRPAGAGCDLDCGIRTHPARQGEEASVAVARLHGVEDRSVFVRQNPKAIDAGVFHNDVISVGNEDVLLVHELAYGDGGSGHADALRRIGEAVRARCGVDLTVFSVSADELSVDDAVGTYLFNSQLVTLPETAESDPGGRGRMVLIAPSEVEENPASRACVDRLLDEVPQMGGAVFVDVRESMRNGGGPACLRLRVVMTQSFSSRAAVKVLPVVSRSQRWAGPRLDS
jgi:succinylarginine dihydrolase